LDTQEDKDVAVEAIKVVRNIIKQPRLRQYEPEEYLPGAELQSDDDLVRAAGEIGTTIFHPVGTAKMGRDDDPAAVVDSRLRVRGIDASEVDARDRRKSISSERTFFADIDDDDELERRLLELSCSVGGQLRAKELRARTVTVKLRDHDYRTRQAGSTQPDGVETDRAIFAVAASLLHGLRHRRRTPARLLGVGVSNLVRQVPAEQLEFFGEGAKVETERDRTVARAVDRIRERFGREALRPGRVLDKPER